MKNVIMIMLSVMLGILMMAMIFAISGKMNRSAEIKNNLPAAAEQTVGDLMGEDGTARYGWEEMTADFAARLAAACDTDSDVVLEICNIDAKKGLLSVRVIEEFRYANGKRGSTESSRTVIWDRPVLPEPEYPAF